MPLLLIILVVVIAAIAVVAISRANELFFVSVRDGRCLVVRGSVPPSVWSELRLVVRMSGARRGSIRAFKEGGSPRVVVQGLGEGTAQRLRNAFGARGFHRATASGAAAAAGGGGQNLGQLLGVAWLAWLLTRRRP
jgi:hypothetical protein